MLPLRVALVNLMQLGMFVTYMFPTLAQWTAEALDYTMSLFVSWAIVYTPYHLI